MMRPHFFLLLALLPSLVVPTLAQRRDLRLSPPEPVSYAMPQTIALQSVARIGGLSLVVWGSTRTIADGAIRGMIVAQRVRGGVALDTPREIHSITARPSNRLYAFECESAFVVIWNDLRPEAPGLYGVTIDTAGSISPEYRLGEAATWLGSAGAGGTRSLVWSTANAQTIVQSFDIDGTLRPAVDTLVGTVRRSVSLEDVVRGTLIELDSGGWRYIDARGTVDARQPRAIVGDAWWVLRDTSVVVLIGDTVRKYSSLFDSTSTTFGGIPSLGRISGSESVAVDSAGLFVVGVRESEAPYADTFDIVRWRIQDGGPVTAEVLKRQRYEDAMFRDGAYAQVVRVSRLRGCNGSTVVDCLLDIWSNLPYSHYSDHVGYSIDARATVRLTADEGLLDCGNSRGLSIQRISSDTMSIVRLIADSDTTLVSTPTGWLPIEVRQSSPGLHRVADQTLVTWWGPGTALFGVWNDASDTVSSAPIALSRPDMPLSKVETYTRSDVVTRSDGAVLVGSTHVASARSQNPRFPFLETHANYAAYVPTPSGWKGGVARAHSDVTSFAFNTLLPTFDPNTGEHAIAVTTGLRSNEPTGWWIYAMDSMGSISIRDSASLSADRGGTIMKGVDGGHVLLDASEVVAIERGVATPRFSFDTSLASVRFDRLAGRSFLRSWIDASAPQVIHLERYDVDTGLVARCALSADQPIRYHFISETRLDGSIFVLFDADGVRAHRVSTDLRELSSNVAVSLTREHVGPMASLVRGDSLVVAWEDYRNGGSDIYGTALAIDEIPSRIDRQAGRVKAILAGLHPMPASDRIEVELAIPSVGETNLHVVDVQGGVCSQSVVAPGRMHASLALDRCANGVYVLVVRSGERTETSRVVVMR